VVVEVGVAVKVVELVGVPVAVDVLVAERVVVVDPDAVMEAVAVNVVVEETETVVEEVAVGGNAVGLTETASCPTTRLTPQISGRLRVAE